jgi:tRNA threonylcarbamoyladenosine biosynthesis protein TsaB
MRVLGIDTSAYTNAVGVVDGDRVLADLIYEARTDTLEMIVANVDSALQAAGLLLEDVQGIGVGLGPGSWTGIRVGVTVAKILAYSAGKPVCGVPTLEVLAYHARNESSLICPVISAGTRDTVYAAFYRAQDDNVIKIGEYYVGGMAGLSAMVREPVVFVGSGIHAISLTGGNRAVEAAPCGSAVARLASIRLAMGESDDVLGLTPLYLKESTARAFLGRYAAKARGKAGA